MNSTKSNRALTTFGIATFAIWLSYLAYLPPFTPWPDVERFAQDGWEAGEVVQGKYQSIEDIERKLNRNLYIAYVKGYVMTISGMIAGTLILARRRAGRYLALTLAAIMIGSRIVAAVKNQQGIIEWFKVIYGYLLFQMPIPIIQKDIIAPLFFIYSIVFLCGKSGSRHFANRRLTTG